MLFQEQTYVEISDLQPNSMYFLQVQTISIFGLGKLRSEKAAIFYNTTSIAEGIHLPFWNSNNISLLAIACILYTPAARIWSLKMYKCSVRERSGKSRDFHMNCLYIFTKFLKVCIMIFFYTVFIFTFPQQMLQRLSRGGRTRNS